MRYLFFVFISLLAAIGFADDATKSASKTQLWIGQTTPSLQVKLDMMTRGIAVTLPNKDQNPKSIGITLFDANGNRTNLELKAVAPWQGLGVNPELSQTHFSGTLSPSNQAFIGFELQIPFGSESPIIIRSEDLKKSD